MKTRMAALNPVCSVAVTCASMSLAFCSGKGRRSLSVLVDLMASKRRPHGFHDQTLEVMFRSISLTNLSWKRNKDFPITQEVDAVERMQKRIVLQSTRFKIECFLANSQQKGFLTVSLSFLKAAEVSVATTHLGQSQKQQQEQLRRGLRMSCPLLVLEIWC